MTATAVRLTKILIVAGEHSCRTKLRQAFEGHHYTVIDAVDEPDAVQALSAHRPSVVLTNLHLSHGDAFGVLRAAKELNADTSVIVTSTRGRVEDAVRAIKEGAIDFLVQPLDPDRLLQIVDRAVGERRLVSARGGHRAALVAPHGLSEIVGEHSSLKAVVSALRRAATSEVTVLLAGESGTGKELFARALHELSPRANGPFVAINCAAIPEMLLESELFGHEKGAFTGAAVRKPGRFETAHGGTLLLDEIGDLTLPLQAKILRAIEDREFDRVGGTTPIRVDVRIVAASNRDLPAAVSARQFREDLYFRLSVFPIEIPPLRERADDIPLLARFFVGRCSRDVGRSGLGLSPAAEDALVRYHWPGNVRELQNSIERAVILCDATEIHPRHLNLGPDTEGRDERIVDPWDLLDVSGSLEDASVRIYSQFERHKLRHALRESRGSRELAAIQLKISPRDLEIKLTHHALDRDPPSAKHRTQ